MKRKIPYIEVVIPVLVVLMVLGFYWWIFTGVKEPTASITSQEEQADLIHPITLREKYVDQYSSVSEELAQSKGCLSCHDGIEKIRKEESGMMQSILALGKSHGDNNGCVVCHGGRPDATTFVEAHSGIPETMKSLPKGPKAFYPDPGSIFIADNTCGQCHPGYAYRLERSLMNTEAGKIQGNLHTWGVEEVQNYNVPWGNYDVKDEDGPVPIIGTETYKEYMTAMIEKFPKQFPKELKQIPQPTVEEIEENPHLAGFTYQRQQCQRCHVAVKGREKRGDYRGMGCAACHILYGNEGIYQGNDPTIDKSEKGHAMAHRIYGTREADNGIPVESCNSCHNRGKRIGVTYQGLMEFPYGSPFSDTTDSGKQPKLHTKQYLFVSDDLHHQIESRPENPRGGMLCQDCHTTIDIHGDGNIFGTTLAQVEIECQDCHGTPEVYPWDLPIGYSEEFGRGLPETPRGLAERPLMETEAFATAYPKEDGYLLTARGNPFGNVVKKGNDVIVHSATGVDFKVPVLKEISRKNTWKSPDAQVAMSSVKSHAQKMECYTCHASWVPQCYGCHVKMDFSAGGDGKPLMDIDWVASGSQNDISGQTAESTLGIGGIKSPGKARESRSYLRWEDPVLGINGEGRVTPLMPGCQVIFTVIDREGNTLIKNNIATVEDEAIAANQKEHPLAIDMAPVQPHSAQRKARTCESCHNNPKTAGYGIGGGVFQNKYAKPMVADLINQRTGEPIVSNYQNQIEAIPKLDFDLSTIVDKETGVQVATVGTHWPLSRALNKEERKRLTKTGLCMGCHRTMTDTKFWNTVNSKKFVSSEEHIEVMNKMIRAYYNEKK